MRNGICPKCGYNDIRVGKQEATRLGQPTTVLGMQAVATDVNMNYDIYVCLYCGYVEMGISDANALHSIAQKWPGVGQPPPQ